MYRLFVISEDLKLKFARSSLDVDKLIELATIIAEQKQHDCVIYKGNPDLGQKRTVQALIRYCSNGSREWVEVTNNIAGEEIVQKFRIYRGQDGED